ncbi:MAG: hypothetical protein G01um101418_971 [Parcubacteria group bacterium Gr01-1014_18]|nr:MAG: hypothetical protein Greene041636_976 [Parcubacteria group bacterium Greene0416_36]TSC79511.1 MAG: hypothetical protein G01um101418_971 [Parcubacteria group bacterium Gr01-1014_18]TSC97817.1 MAG: hypothetical protein Greene101420_981 [Parcubacteria group bacterium Greene1014_20]TSD05956.1 MAG: hypothetical protein Greene07142_979 [Parcubacteria group bacterium Greene0714_2]
MGLKIMISFVAGVAVGAFAWYTLSPLWNNVEIDEKLPGMMYSQEDMMMNSEKMGMKMVGKYADEMMKMKEEIMDKKETMPIPTTVRYRAPFVAKAHDVKGEAMIIESAGKKYVRFENFQTINGPDVRIYLASGLDNTDIVDLGSIKATKGNVNYEIPDNVDLAIYKNVLVWCEDFSVLFSYATLK